MCRGSVQLEISIGNQDLNWAEFQMGVYCVLVKISLNKLKMCIAFYCDVVFVYPPSKVLGAIHCQHVLIICSVIAIHGQHVFIIYSVIALHGQLVFINCSVM